MGEIPSHWFTREMELGELVRHYDWSQHIKNFKYLHILYHARRFTYFLQRHVNHRNLCFHGLLAGSLRECQRQRLRILSSPEPVDEACDSYYAPAFLPNGRCQSLACVNEQAIMRFPEEMRLSEDFPILYTLWDAREWDGFLQNPDTHERAFKAMFCDVVRAVKKDRRLKVINSNIIERERVIARVLMSPENQPIPHQQANHQLRDLEAAQLERERQSAGLTPPREFQQAVQERLNEAPHAYHHRHDDHLRQPSVSTQPEQVLLNQPIENEPHEVPVIKEEIKEEENRDDVQAEGTEGEPRGSGQGGARAEAAEEVGGVTAEDSEERREDDGLQQQPQPLLVDDQLQIRRSLRIHLRNAQPAEIPRGVVLPQLIEMKKKGRKRLCGCTLKRRK